MGGGKTVGDLDAGGENQLEIGGALCDDLVQGFARDVLHYDVGFGLVAILSRGFADVVDSADVGVIDGGGESCFAELGGADLLESECAAFQQFEDDGALEEGVLRKKDDA